VVPELILAVHWITFHAVLKVCHDCEHGIICWSGKYGTKRFKWEIFWNHQVYEEVVHAKLDWKPCYNQNKCHQPDAGNEPRE